MRAMVVGGAGFIGSHLVDRLLAEQHAVDVVDDLSTGTLANLASARTSGGEVKIHHLDACTDDFLSLVALREPEVVFHLGWLPPGRPQPAVLARGLHSTLNVLEAARLHGVAKVVTTLPAVALYGDVPVRDQPVKEGHAHAPQGAAGVVAEAVAQLLAAYRADHDVEFSALALATVYGPRQRPDGGVVAAFAEAVVTGVPATIHGDGRQTRDFIFIDDVVDALARAAQRGSGLVINIGTGTPTSIRELWAAVAGPDAATAQIGDVAKVGVARCSLAPTRARIHLSWAPWTDLRTGLAQLAI
ncbi:MAG: NAD-dependent epimerase/dehydratase family protein [Ilumatobacteraceae bacterium]